MSRHPVRCKECGSNFGHDEGCPQANAAMVRDALIAGKSIPGRCLRCGGEYVHLRGCSLEDLTLQAIQENYIRNNPEDVSEFDVCCLLHEIDRMRKDRDDVFRNAVDAMKAKEIELEQMRTELAEANRCWRGALEAQAGLESELEYIEKKICKWAGITHGSVDWSELQVLHSRLHSKGCSHE